MHFKGPLRGYFFGNMYLSPIQHGIQAAHVVTKMFLLTEQKTTASSVLYDWAHSPTKILLNGGYQSNLAAIYSIFEIVCPNLGIPFAKFHEEQEALNGALTSVGVVVPEEMYAKPEDQMLEWTGPIDGAFLKGCVQPHEILEKVMEWKDHFANRDLRNDFFAAALHLTLKSCRLA